MKQRIRSLNEFINETKVNESNYDTSFETFQKQYPGIKDIPIKEIYDDIKNLSRDEFVKKPCVLHPTKSERGEIWDKWNSNENANAKVVEKNENPVLLESSSDDKEFKKMMGDIVDVIYDNTPVNCFDPTARKKIEEIILRYTEKKPK